MIKLTEKEKLARKRVCLPLDGLQSLSELEDRVKELSPVVGLFKIGKESFTRFGLDSIKAVNDYGAKVFLDLKYHDIPNTVKGAAKAAAQLGVYMFNVHASGGLEMMRAAVAGVFEGCSETYNLLPPRIVGVTVLTSIDENTLNNQMRVLGKVEDQVLNLARLSREACLNGIVCSAADLYAIRDKLPKNFIYVTPGIKGTKTPAGADQKRVFSPGNAIRDGATILVVGRAITDQKTPEERVQAGYEILQDMAQHL